MQFLIYSREHNSWWKPGERGYTFFEQEAGRYSLADATRICRNANAHIDLTTSGLGVNEFCYPAPEDVL